MYLPTKIPKARVLITVKTYPLPSSKYKELVCTAGLIDGKKWIRIFPVAYRFLSDNKQYPKYGWIEINLIRNKKDFRPESYRPQSGIDEDIKLIEKIGTSKKWAERKTLVLNEVFVSMSELINLAKSESKKSLATLKPTEIIDFIIKEDERKWKDKWVALSKQGNIFDLEMNKSSNTSLYPIKKLPYKYYYKFITKGDSKPKTLLIQDWEIGALFWNCMRQTDGDEIAANRLVKKKYFDSFVTEKDIHLFLGTTQRFHNVAPNPFVIVGVFYPPKIHPLPLFE